MNSSSAPVGVIGVGHLVRHMMPSMVTSGRSFLLSARGKATAQALSQEFGLKIVNDNADIVDRASLIILAVRPYDALDVCRGLPWRADQTVLSLCAGVDNDALRQAIAPADLVTAMPVVAAQFAESPTLQFPANDECKALLETCGPVIVLDDEAQYPAAAVMACYYGWVHALIGEMTSWARAQGLDGDKARLLVAQMTRAAATSVRERSDVSVDELIGELATPRSFTGLGLEELRVRDAFAPWREAAERIRCEYDPT